MNTSLEVCEERDAKGLYKLARAGKIKGINLLPNSEIGVCDKVFLMA